MKGIKQEVEVTWRSINCSMAQRLWRILQNSQTEFWILNHGTKVFHYKLLMKLMTNVFNYNLKRIREIHRLL